MLCESAQVAELFSKALTVLILVLMEDALRDDDMDYVTYDILS